MDTFELFNNGKLVLPEKEAGFAGIEWSKHPAFKGVELKHIITAKDTDGKFSYHLVRIAPGCSIGNHIHETQLETHEVIKGRGRCVNAGSTIPYETGQSPSCRRVCRMKSLQVQRDYICLPSLCLHYVELNKRIISKTAAMAHRHMRRSAILIGTARICVHGGLRLRHIAGAAAPISDEWRKTLAISVIF